MAAADDLLRHQAWLNEQETIRLKREEAKRLLDGNPDARRELEARWAPVTDVPPTH